MNEEYTFKVKKITLILQLLMVGQCWAPAEIAAPHNAELASSMKPKGGLVSQYLFRNEPVSRTTMQRPASAPHLITQQPVPAFKTLRGPEPRPLEIVKGSAEFKAPLSKTKSLSNLPKQESVVKSAAPNATLQRPGEAPAFKTLRGLEPRPLEIVKGSAHQEASTNATLQRSASTSHLITPQPIELVHNNQTLQRSPTLFLKPSTSHLTLEPRPLKIVRESAHQETSTNATLQRSASLSNLPKQESVIKSAEPQAPSFKTLQGPGEPLQRSASVSDLAKQKSVVKSPEPQTSTNATLQRSASVSDLAKQPITPLVELAPNASALSSTPHQLLRSSESKSNLALERNKSTKNKNTPDTLSDRNARLIEEKLSRGEVNEIDERIDELHTFLTKPKNELYQIITPEDHLYFLDQIIKLDQDILIFEKKYNTTEIKNDSQLQTKLQEIKSTFSKENYDARAKYHGFEPDPKREKEINDYMEKEKKIDADLHKKDSRESREREIAREYALRSPEWRAVQEQIKAVDYIWKEGEPRIVSLADFNLAEQKRGERIEAVIEKAKKEGYDFRGESKRSLEPESAWASRTRQAQEAEAAEKAETAALKDAKKRQPLLERLKMIFRSKSSVSDLAKQEPIVRSAEPQIALDPLEDPFTLIPKIIERLKTPASFTNDVAKLDYYDFILNIEKVITYQKAKNHHVRGEVNYQKMDRNKIDTLLSDLKKRVTDIKKQLGEPFNKYKKYQAEITPPHHEGYVLPSEKPTISTSTKPPETAPTTAPEATKPPSSATLQRSGSISHQSGAESPLTLIPKFIKELKINLENPAEFASNAMRESYYDYIMHIEKNINIIKIQNRHYRFETNSETMRRKEIETLLSDFNKIVKDTKKQLGEPFNKYVKDLKTLEKRQFLIRSGFIEPTIIRSHNTNKITTQK